MHASLLGAIRLVLIICAGAVRDRDQDWLKSLKTDATSGDAVEGPWPRADDRVPSALQQDGSATDVHRNKPATTRLDLDLRMHRRGGRSEQKAWNVSFQVR